MHCLVMINRRRNKKKQQKNTTRSTKHKNNFFLFVFYERNKKLNKFLLGFQAKQTHTLCLANTQTNSCQRTHKRTLCKSIRIIEMNGRLLLALFYPQFKIQYTFQRFCCCCSCFNFCFPLQLLWLLLLFLRHFNLDRK